LHNHTITDPFAKLPLEAVEAAAEVKEIQFPPFFAAAERKISIARLLLITLCLSFACLLLSDAVELSINLSAHIIRLPLGIVFCRKRLKPSKFHAKNCNLNNALQAMIPNICRIKCFMLHKLLMEGRTRKDDECQHEVLC